MGPGSGALGSPRKPCIAHEKDEEPRQCQLTPRHQLIWSETHGGKPWETPRNHLLAPGWNFSKLMGHEARLRLGAGAPLLVVASTNAIVDPWTVVVHLQDACPESMRSASMGAIL